MDNNDEKLEIKPMFTGSYWQWLKEELLSIPKTPWFFFGLGVGIELALFLTAPINLLSVIAFISTCFGIGCVCAMSSGNTINGLLGAISVVGYVIINFQAHHWFSIFDQLCFFLLIDVPLMKNWRNWGRGKDTNIKSLHAKGWVITAILILIEWAVFYGLAVVTKDSQPITDALVLAIGATASWLCYKRYTQTYSLWLISDCINAILWFVALKDGYSQSSLPMLAMTLFYTATSIYGRFFSVWNGKRNVDNDDIESYEHQN